MLIIIIVIDAFVPGINLSSISPQALFVAGSVLMERDSVFSLPIHTMFSSLSRGHWRDKSGGRDSFSGFCCFLLQSFCCQHHIWEHSLGLTPTSFGGSSVDNFPLICGVHLWANPQCVSQAFQWLASLSGPHMVGFQLASHGCGSLPICFNLPVLRWSISCWSLSVAAPCPPALAWYLWTSAFRNTMNFAAIQQNTNCTFFNEVSSMLREGPRLSSLFLL